MASNGNGEFTFANGNGTAAVANGNGTARNGLAKIQTQKKGNGMCHDDSTPPVKAQTIDELHSLQKKKSAPTTPIKGTQGGAFAITLSEVERQKQQLQSISASLASLTRETGPKVVRGDPAKQSDTPKVSSHVSHHHHFTPTISVSDSALKFTHVLYNLSPAELYEQAIKYEKGSFITSTGALATLSGAKTGRSPRDKRVVKDDTTEDELWWGRGSPNIEMDEHTFMVNRERAVDYLNSLDKVFVNDQFLNWDPENRIKVRIVSARAYHSLFMHNMCIRPTPEELENFGTPDFTIYNAGQFPCNRYTHYMTSSTSIDLNLARREMVILGTMYAGEMKKGLFSVMHYLMPKRQILSLHSGCNMGKDGDVALFFGLSGTGKTTLSTDHNRYLIGDDEHCWRTLAASEIHNCQLSDKIWDNQNWTRLKGFAVSTTQTLLLLLRLMGSAAVEKTEEDLRKEIDELQRQQREITERLRDPRGLRKGGLAAAGPRNFAANGARPRGFTRPADRPDEDQPPAKRRLSSAVVKVEDGEITEIAEEAKDGKKNDTNEEAKADQSDRKLSNSQQSGWSKRDGNHGAAKKDFEIPAPDHVPRVLPKEQDPSLVNRNKRMLGQLLGTLEKFRKEDMQLSGTEAFMRRSNSLQRAEQRAREESERLRQQEREQIAEKRRRDLTLRARVNAKTEEKRLELLFLQWSEHNKKLCNFIRTKAEPPIYYLPKKPLDEDPTLAEQRKEKEFLEWKAARREELTEYQKQIGEQCIANAEKELERWQNARKPRKANNDVMNLQETMDKELDTHRLEHGPKKRKIPDGSNNDEDEDDVEDINVAEDYMIDDVLDVDDNSRRIDEIVKPEAGKTSPNADAVE